VQILILNITLLMYFDRN